MPLLDDARTQLVTARILDVAEAIFARRGIAAVDMGEVARAAGCSRATLYRYFASRNALLLAYMQREAHRVAALAAQAAGGAKTPQQRLLVATLKALQAVRKSPALLAWFSQAESGLTAELTSASPAIETIVVAFLRAASTDAPAEAELLARARWLVRVIVSLLAMPPRDGREERRLLEKFVLPVVLPVPSRSRSRG